jgi:hypothetical protein
MKQGKPLKKKTTIGIVRGLALARGNDRWGRSMRAEKRRRGGMCDKISGEGRRSIWKPKRTESFSQRV